MFSFLPSAIAADIRCPIPLSLDAAAAGGYKEPPPAGAQR